MYNKILINLIYRAVLMLGDKISATKDTISFTSKLGQHKTFNIKDFKKQ